MTDKLTEGQRQQLRREIEEMPGSDHVYIYMIAKSNYDGDEELAWHEIKKRLKQGKIASWVISKPSE